MLVPFAEIAPYLRMAGSAPGPALAERAQALSSAASAAVRPARVWRRFPVENGAIGSGPHSIPVEGRFAERLAGCRSAILMCGTLGAGFDALHRRVSVLSGADALILQAVGAAMIERVMDSMEAEASASLAPGERLVMRYSPGYAGFPLERQRELLALLDAPRLAGVSLTSSLAMAPSKSVSAVAGIKNVQT